MTAISIAFVLQAIYSFLSTVRVNFAVGDNTTHYVLAGMMSDTVKYGISAGVAIEAVNGSMVIIGTTVIGGMIGNYIGHRKMKGAV